MISKIGCGDCPNEGTVESDDRGSEVEMRRSQKEAAPSNPDMPPIDESPKAPEAIEERRLFDGDPEIFASLPVDAILKLVPKQDCGAFVTILNAKAAEHRASEEPPIAKAYEFLSILCNFHDQFDTPREPYGPMMSAFGRRSPIPDDLRPLDLEALAVAARSVKNSVLSARLNDVLWLRTRNAAACRAAADAYLFIVAENHATDPMIAADVYRRGLYLAQWLGRDRPAYVAVTNTVVASARRACDDAKDFSTSFLLQLLLDYGIGDPSEFAARAGTVAEAARSKKLYNAAERYFTLQATFWRRAKKPEAAEGATREMAETLVQQAAHLAANGDVGCLMAAQHLLRGIQALQGAKGGPERIAELTRLLSDYQQRSLNAFHTISLPQESRDALQKEVEGIATAAAKSVVGQPLFEALLRLAFISPLIDLDKIKAAVTELARGSIAASLFSPMHVDRAGRPISNGPSFTGSDSDPPEVLEQECYHHAHQWIWPQRAVAIEAARAQIQFDHHPGLVDLSFLVRNNPFIESGHEGIVLTGIHAGFHDDLLIAGHVLVPQVESLVRHALSGTGETVVLHADGTQELKSLGSLLDLPSFNEMFGPRLRFELRGLLLEKRGYGFRDSLAHGLLHEGESRSTPALMIWWLVLRLLLIPLREPVE